jgi:hypothetical protein
VGPYEQFSEARMTTKPKTRKAPAKADAPKNFPKEMELGADGMPPPSPFDAIIEAEDILATASKLTDAVYLIALELDEYKCGAICAVADAIRDKITDSLSCSTPTSNRAKRLTYLRRKKP